MKTLTLDQALFVIAGRPDLAFSVKDRPALSGWVVGQLSLGDRESLSTSGEMAVKAEATFLELARSGKLTVLDEVDGELRHVEPPRFEGATFHYGGGPDFAVTLRRTDWEGSRDATEGGAILTTHFVRTISGRVDADQLQEILKPPVLSKPKRKTGKYLLVIDRLSQLYPVRVPDHVSRKLLRADLIDTTPGLHNSLDEGTLLKAITEYNKSKQNQRD
jgi:hypothetical protein